jgi:hypothetical protein
LRKRTLQQVSPERDASVDTPPNAPIKCLSRTRGKRSTLRKSAVTLIKIIIITLAVILSILFFGRFLF